MHSDDLLGNGNPVEGKGSEMIPDKGLPFGVDGEMPSGAVDLTPQELEDLLMGGVRNTPSDSALPVQPDSGMGAAFPVLDDDLPAGDSGAPIIEEDRSALSAELVAVLAHGAGTNPAPAPAEPTEAASFGQDTSPEMAALFLTDVRLNELWTRMDAAQQSVRVAVPSIDLARKLMGEIEAGRNLLLQNRDNFEEAERKINEVELEVTIIQRSLSESGSATRLFLYELFWSIVLIVVLVLSGIGINIPWLKDNMVYAINSAAWGGLGGIVGAIFALWRHVTIDMDFSKTYSLWYITNPIMGIFLGVVMYLIMLAGLFSLTLGASAQEISSPYIIYVVAFVVGYQQNVAWELIRRIIKVVFQVNESEK